MSSSKQHHPATPATQALDKAGVSWTAHLYDHDPRSHSFGLEAAEVLRFAPERTFKTLVVTSNGKQGIAVIPASSSLNLKKAASSLAEAGLAGARSVEMAEERVAQSATGYVVGGISPLGTKRNLPTVLDSSADQFETILVSGGRRGFSVEVRPQDLVRLTNAVVGSVTR